MSVEPAHSVSQPRLSASLILPWPASANGDIDLLSRKRYLTDREELLLSSRSLTVTEMASTLAHEINQPLGAVASLLNVLKLKMEKGDAAAGETIKLIDKALTHLGFASGVILRVREFVDRWKPHKEVGHLSSLAERAVDLLDWEFGQSGIRIVFERHASRDVINADPIMIQQVITNLLRNAIEAMRTRPERERLLRIHIEAEETGSNVLTISDTGPGLAPDMEERLFSPFASTKAGGMGVGLSICRSLIELHSGRLWHTPNKAGGASFHIALPIHTEDSQP